MDLLTFGLITLGALVLLAIVALMLNRAWGDVPGRVGPGTSSLPGSSSRPDSTQGGVSGASAAPHPFANPLAAQPAPDELPAGAPEGSLIAIQSPLVRRAIEAAMEKGGSPYVAYFIRHGDTIYFNAARVADPEQRERIRRMINEVNGAQAGDISIKDAVRAAQELMRLQ